MPDEKNRPLDFLGTIFAVVIGVGIATGIRCNRQESIENKIDKLLQKSTPQLRTENVIGGEAPEKFYEINGQRVYLEIDGKPVEQYVRRE